MKNKKHYALNLIYSSINIVYYGRRRRLFFVRVAFAVVWGGGVLRVGAEYCNYLRAKKTFSPICTQLILCDACVEFRSFWYIQGESKWDSFSARRKHAFLFDEEVKMDLIRYSEDFNTTKAQIMDVSRYSIGTQRNIYEMCETPTNLIFQVFQFI